MKIENNLILGTASEIASVLCADFKEPISCKSAKQFKECDFAVAPETWYSTDTVKQISNRAENWYGIKTINTDFDNPALELFVDCYESCAGYYFTLETEMKKEAVERVEVAMLASLNANGESVTGDTLLVGEMKEDKNGTVL